MADQTKRADVLQIALATAFRHWKNMIGVPQAAARHGAETPFFETLLAANAARPLQLKMRLNSIDFA